MKKKLILILIFIISSLGIFGCSSSEEKADDTVNSFFTSAKNFDINGIKTLIDTADSKEIINIDEQLNGTSKVFIDYMKENAKEITYEIKNTVITDNEAIVTVNAKYVDSSDLLSIIISEAIPKLFSLAFSGSEPTDEEIENIITEILNEKASSIDKKYKEVTINISLIKKDDKWYITKLSDEVYDIISSGIYSVAQGISEQFNLTQ